jgi:hypothetical protein
MKNIKTYNEFERLNEGRYDSFVRQITKDIFYNIKQTEGDLDNPTTFYLPEEITEEDFYYHESGVQFELVLIVMRVYGPIKNNKKEVSFIVDTYIDTEDSLVMQIIIDENYGEKVYEELFYKISEDIRHEIEHYVQEIDKKEQEFGYSEKERRYKQRKQPLIPNTAEYKTTFDHHRDPSEVEALVHGFSRRSKLEKKPLDLIMRQDLDLEIDSGSLTEKEADILFSIWKNKAKELNLIKRK